MLRTIFCYTIGFVYALFKLLILQLANYFEKAEESQEFDNYVYRQTGKLSRFLFYLTGSKIKVIGREKIPCNQQVLFVSNHQSHMDSIIIHGFIGVPKGFVSIVNVSKTPVLSTLMKYMKCVFLDRNDIRQMFKCIEEATELLKKGHSMVIFPEGKLSECDEVGEFQKGSLRMAIKAGVPIVPITLKNSWRIMNRKGLNIKPAHVECIISNPIEAVALNKEEESKLVKIVRDAIVSA